MLRYKVRCVIKRCSMRYRTTISLGFGLRRFQRTAGEAYPDAALGARAGQGAKRDVPRTALGTKT